MSNPPSIIFYDGACGLCQRSISFLAKIDSQKRLKFAPLNGLTYYSYNLLESSMESVVFYNKGKLFEKSQALIEVARFLGGWIRLLLIMLIIPKTLRDWAYEKIANNRKKVSCIILIKDARFLP